MSNNNDKKNSHDGDMITPFLELISFAVVGVFKLFWELIKYAYINLKPIDPSNIEVTKIEPKQLKSKSTTRHPMAVGMDTKTGYEIVFPEINFKHHSFIVGSSGYGKTNLISILQENTLRKKLPIIFFDPKGDAEAMDTFKSICHQYNRKCYVFSEYCQDSVKLNPLKEGSVSVVVDRLMSSFEWSEQFYKESCKELLFDVVKEIKRDSNLTLNLKSLYQVLNKKKDKDSKGIVTKIRAILESDFGNKFSDDIGVSLYDIRKERACLYIGLSTQGHGETAIGIGKLLFNELKNHSYEMMKSHELKKWALERPIGVYIDEFGALVQKDFIEIQNKCRGAGIEITIAVQTAADIAIVNQELKNQIIENTGNIFILKQRLDENASYFSDAVGTVLSQKMTYTTLDGEIGDRGSLREVHESIVHSNIIKSLRAGQCVLLRQNPTQVNLINIRRRKEIEPTFNIKITSKKIERGAFSAII